METLKTPKGRHIREGNIYNNVRVVSLYSYDPKNRYYKYKCECLNCGTTFISGSQTITNYSKNNICPECLKKGNEIKRKKESEKHIGERYGYLEIIGYAGLKKLDQKRSVITPYMICKCHKCGSTTDIPLTKLVNGYANECANCRKNYLEKGWKANEDYHKGGSYIGSIESRKLNKNNASGHNGVSWNKKQKNWRAYIVFKRKQYHLGTYEKLEDAVKARKEGEKEIYGSFLAWYKETYPEYWKRFERNKKKKNE